MDETKNLGTVRLFTAYCSGPRDRIPLKRASFLPSPADALCSHKR